MAKIVQHKDCGILNINFVFSPACRALTAYLGKGVACALTLVMGLTCSLSSFAQVTIETENQSEKELKIKYMLEGLQEKYNLRPWIYTKQILVDADARTPHSHPVLTMSTQSEYLNSEIQLLSTFLHEQFHWHVIKNANAPKGEFKKVIGAKFPDVQFARPFGSGSELSTLNHLIVCYLEYKALASLIGQAEASQALAVKDYYIGIYKTVLDPKNHDKLEALVNQFGLQIELGGKGRDKPAGVGAIGQIDPGAPGIINHT